MWKKSEPRVLREGAGSFRQPLCPGFSTDVWKGALCPGTVLLGLTCQGPWLTSSGDPAPCPSLALLLPPSPVGLGIQIPKGSGDCWPYLSPLTLLNPTPPLLLPPFPFPLPPFLPSLVGASTPYSPTISSLESRLCSSASVACLNLGSTFFGQWNASGNRELVATLSLHPPAPNPSQHQSLFQ